MDAFVIEGGSALQGDIRIGGAKNAALPLMIASLLTEEEVILENIPHLTDVITLSQLLENFGVKVTASSSHQIEDLSSIQADPFAIHLKADSIHCWFAPYSIVRKMRATFWTLGPLLARFGQAKISLPGGCAIGVRPVDFHLAILEAMGAKIALQEGYIVASASGKLKGCTFTFNKVSVGATITGILSATLAQGECIFINCACEPEIVDLCRLLVKMGAHIEGIGTPQIRVKGAQYLRGARHSIIPDRIEAGTYIAAAGLTKGKLKLHGIPYTLVKNVCTKFKDAGIKIIPMDESTILASFNGEVKPVDIQTAPYPGFPTDMQAQFMALMCIAQGVSVITENLFENRFMHVLELSRMGAGIQLHRNSAVVKGNTIFQGAHLTATDLRASICLVLASLAAQGESRIRRVYHIDRGYSQIEKKLSKCGAKIQRIKEGD